jgi:tubulin monoglycylase TTLL3/8
MQDIAKSSVESVVNSIDPERLTHTFELFGYDFMIDESFNVSLIEINTNPDLEICCNLL